MMNGEFFRDTALRACVVALGLAATSLPALAQNYYGLLKNAPAEKFTDEDMRLFNEAASKVLNEAAVGEIVRWENPATKSHGELKVVKTFTWRDSPCREVSVHNEARGRKATNLLYMCRTDDKWRMVSPTDMKKG